MPLRIEVLPFPLEHLSLARFVTLILKSCQSNPDGEVKAIQELARSIPVTLANRYVRRILFAIDWGQQYQGVNIRDALCPWCTRVSITTFGAEMKLLYNLDRLRNLTHLCLGWANPALEQPEIAGFVSKHLPRLRKLRSLRIASVVTDESHLFKRLAKYCPNLEELSIRWGLSRNQPVTLAGCLKLKRVFVEYCGGRMEDVIYILDSVPQLEILLINRSLVNPLLRSIRKTYQLKQLNLYDYHEKKDNNFNLIDGSEMLSCLARHFPKLDEGTFFRCKDLSPINRFVEMRSLHIAHSSAKQVSGLKRLLFFRLRRLSMSNITKVASALTGIKRLSMPNLLELDLFECSHVDLQLIGKLCPQVRDLTLTRCTPTPFNPQEKSTPFKKLQKIIITDKNDSFNCLHFMHLISESRDLHMLEIVQKSYLDNSMVYTLLKYNPMPLMYCFSITSNRLTPEVASVVFHFFGDALVVACFKGNQLEQIQEEYLKMIRERMEPYCLFLTLGSIHM